MAYGAIWNSRHNHVCVFDINDAKIDTKNTIILSGDIAYSHTYPSPKEWSGYNLISWDRFKLRYNIKIEDLYKELDL